MSLNVILRKREKEKGSRGSDVGMRGCRDGVEGDGMTVEG